MALLEYFKKRASTSAGELPKAVVLSDKNGPLSREIPSSLIREKQMKKFQMYLKQLENVSHILKVPDDI